MRSILLFMFLIQMGGSYAQEEQKVERLWVNLNCSFGRYGELGGQIQIFDQFLAGIYVQSLYRNVGPGVPKNPYALLWRKVDYKKDYVNSGALMIGFASPTPHRVMFSFLGGPNLNKIITNSDFKVTYSGGDYYSYVSAVSSTVTEQWKIGVNYKATLSFMVGDFVCLNFGLSGNYNGIDNYNRFIYGIGGGEFGCKKRSSKYRHVIIED